MMAITQPLESHCHGSGRSNRSVKRASSPTINRGM